MITSISNYNSYKITALSFVAIYFVLVIHANYDGMLLKHWSAILQGGLGATGMSLAAVPMFYFISGMLFFKGVTSAKDCLPRIRKRARSLLVPYLIWNVIFVLWYVVLTFTPGVSTFVNSNVLVNIDVQHPIDTLNYLFVAPAGFQLWYLRDLILYVILTPVLYLLIKRMPILTYILLLVIVGGIPRCGITYFTLGAILAVHSDFDSLKRCLSKPVIAIIVVLYIIHCVHASGALRLPVSVLDPYYQQVVSVIGIISIWGVYDWIAELSKKRPISSTIPKTSFLNYTFFVYLFHEPVFNIIKKLGLYMFGSGDVALVIMYVVNPFIMLMTAIYIGKFINLLSPKIYSFLVGGR